MTNPHYSVIKKLYWRTYYTILLQINPYEIPNRSPKDPQKIPKRSPRDPHEIPMRSPKRSPRDPYEIPKRSPKDPKRNPYIGSPQSFFKIPNKIHLLISYSFPVTLYYNSL